MNAKEQLLEKMQQEQAKYRDWLTAQPPEEILNHTYEYTVREDILMEAAHLPLKIEQIRVLLASPAPLSDIYKDFDKLETGYMSIVAECIEGRANDLLKPEQRKNPPKVYLQSAKYARDHGELEQYRESYRLNERCRDEINGAIAQRFNGMNLSAGAVEQVVQEYGLERTRFVVAAAIQERAWDARISPANKKWADSVRSIKDMDGSGVDRATYFASMQAHSCLLDSFASDVRKFERTKSHTKKEPER